METPSNKKGVSKEAQALTRKLRDRFVEFVKNEGLSEVSKRTGCNYQALRNSVVDGYNPSPDTVFQVKLGYGEEFDEVYIFTGKKVQTHNPADSVSVENISNNQAEVMQERLDMLQEKLNEKEQQIQELKQDKAFLQDLVKKQWLESATRI